MLTFCKLLLLTISAAESLVAAKNERVCSDTQCLQGRTASHGESCSFAKILTHLPKCSLSPTPFHSYPGITPVLLSWISPNPWNPSLFPCLFKPTATSPPRSMLLANRSQYGHPIQTSCSLHPHIQAKGYRLVSTGKVYTFHLGRTRTSARAKFSGTQWPIVNSSHPAYQGARS